MLSFLHAWVYDSHMGGVVLLVTREVNDMKTIKVTTPVGEFTRTTKSDYTHVVVRKSDRAKSVYEKFLSSGDKSGSGVDARWIKDRGFAVTYHASLRSAANAANQKYGWDYKAEVIGIYEVAA